MATSSTPLPSLGNPAESKPQNGDHVLKTMKPQNGIHRLRWWRRVKEEMRIKDWKRLAHSAKVGLTLSLVSLSVLLQDVFDKLGHNAIWAIITVVVVFEYTVGGTLSKGLNRGLGTIMAASLGLFVDYMANFIGPTVEPYVVGFSIFVIGMTATYTRFVPSIKAKYDYGVVIFLLTFCLVVISGYRVSDNIDVVFDRIVTIMVGVVACLLVSIFIFPIWAGDDLHNLVIQNFEGLANSLEESLKEYFQGVQKLSRVSSKICKGQPFDDKIYKGYRGVLISKQTEESLANFASWEPRRGRFGCMYPWKRLVEVGAVLRHCAYSVSALHGCVLSEVQAPESLRKVFATSCIRMGEEVARVLRGITCDLKSKRKTKPKKMLLYKVHLAIADLNYAVQTYPQLIYASHIQNPNLNFVNSNHILNPNLNNNDTPFLQEQRFNIQSPSIPQDLQIPSFLSPLPKCSPSTNQALDSHEDLCSNSHVTSNSNSSSHVDLSAYPLPPNPKPPNPCGIGIEVSPHRDKISTPTLNCIINFPPSSNDKGSTTPNKLPPTSTAKSNGESKVCSMLHESMVFAESLSLASLIALLIEIVARVEHLVDAITDFQDQAGYREVKNDEESPCFDSKDAVNHTSNCLIDHPMSISHAK